MSEFTAEITGADQDQFTQELSDHVTVRQDQVQIYAKTERAVDSLTVATTAISAVLAGV